MAPRRSFVTARSRSKEGPNLRQFRSNRTSTESSPRLRPSCTSSMVDRCRRVCTGFGTNHPRAAHRHRCSRAEPAGERPHPRAPPHRPALPSTTALPCTTLHCAALRCAAKSLQCTVRACIALLCLVLRCGTGHIQRLASRRDRLRCSDDGVQTVTGKEGPEHRERFRQSLRFRFEGDSRLDGGAAANVHRR